MPNSFRAVLAAYGTAPGSAGTLPHLTKGDREHLKRWADDDRADEVWNAINCAIRERGFQDGFIEWWFIQEVLGQRSLAESIGSFRKERDVYRRYGAQLQEAANILREKSPDGIQRDELARKLEDVVEQYQTFFAISWDNPGVVRWNRKSKPFDIFISSLSNILKGLAGRWLDYEVAVLTQIAFDDPDIDNDQVIWKRRKVER